jgi:glycolate oxidase
MGDSAAVLTALSGQLSPERLVTDTDVMEAYRRDQAALADAGMPLALVRARSTEDVVATLETASAHGVAVVTREREPARPGPRTPSTAASSCRRRR